MSDLRDILERHVRSGSLPGAVGLVARGDRVEVAAVGSTDVEGTAPMVRDSIFRIASMTKPVTAVAVMTLVEEGLLALEDEIAPWLPELASPLVARTPASPLDDLVPAERPITVFDLLTSRAGYGFPSDFSLPAVGPLVSEVKQGPPQPQHLPGPDEWLKTLSGVPMLYQPGEAFLYNTCSDILGVLIARVSGQSLPEFMAERIFEPLGMADTGFSVPAGDLGRFTSLYRGGDGGLALADAPHGQWSSLPAFPSGAGGLVSTADDWWAFARMLLAQGALDGDRGRLLSAVSVRKVTTDWLTPAQRAAGELFLEGQGWGFGGSVDVVAREPWNVPGRYGWIGGTGTAGHVTPATGAVSILLTQVEMDNPTPPAPMRDVWTYAATA
ncbi:class A beta-lactamase-related serine hydrolase [Streptomyces vinaceus]|uniref:Class A beta-lactamase-related serine hydrolase n=1 Tax=Streptomyces vinaceus TaxID=1960 RepID=A0A5J6J9B5_STRVI|nr:serine hydrolase domain-containing protein [Streptomyces vinaceus]QEV44256.1 class A beta-lactamase-related serine hydrolase [Streptomyces vinaceus]GHE28048.1 serine hydrolase [Streptomyces vinaceus]